MRKRIGIALIVLLVLGALELVNEALVLISAPSDAKMYGGVAVVLGLLIIGPLVINSIWKWSFKKNETPKAA